MYHERNFSSYPSYSNEIHFYEGDLLFIYDNDMGAGGL